MPLSTGPIVASLHGGVRLPGDSDKARFTRAGRKGLSVDNLRQVGVDRSVSQAVVGRRTTPVQLDLKRATEHEPCHSALA